jgi:aspartate racemase
MLVSHEASAERPEEPMKTIGVIGGMGPAATVDFLRRIVEATSASRDQDHLHVLTDCDPSIPDRTDWILGRGPDPTPQLCAVARRLERWGADFLVMPCNSAFVCAPSITAVVDIPLLDWPGIAADATLAEHDGPVGILATKGTIAAGTYQRSFAHRGTETLIPVPRDQLRVSRAIDAVKMDGPSSYAALERLIAAAASLAAAGAQTLLLACTELSAIAGARPVDDPLILALRWVDAAQPVAQEAIRCAGGTVRDTALAVGLGLLR